MCRVGLYEYEWGRFGYPNFLFLNKLVYFVINYSNNIYLVIVKELICQKLIEIGGSKDIDLFIRCIFYLILAFQSLK